MSKFFYALTIAALAELSVVTVPARAANAIVIAGDEAGRIVSLRTKSINNDEVSGEVVNNSPDVLRNVVLELNTPGAGKTNPGKEDPGITVYHTVAMEIPPGGSARFEYKPLPPLPVRRDGHFVIDVKVLGFDRVYR